MKAHVESAITDDFKGADGQCLFPPFTRGASAGDETLTGHTYQGQAAGFQPDLKVQGGS